MIRILIMILSAILFLIAVPYLDTEGKKEARYSSSTCQFYQAKNPIYDRYAKQTIEESAKWVKETEESP